MSFLSMFEQPHQFYGQLDPQAQQAAGQQFYNQFQQSPDPQFQQYAQGMDPNAISPQQLGDMHQFAAQNDPSLLSRVMDHPVLDAALVGFGVHEFHEHEERAGGF